MPDRRRAAVGALPFALAAHAFASGPVTFYATPDEFAAGLLGTAKLLVGVEDFEDGNVPPNSGIGMNDPLDACTSNSVFTPGEIIPGLRIQSNTNGTPDVNDPGTTPDHPHGSTGLAALGPSDDGHIADRCVAPTALGVSFNSLDLICLDDRYTAMWMRAGDVFPSGSGAIEIRVYDPAETLLGMTTLDPADHAGVFIGFITDRSSPIGRVNVWGPGLFACCGADEAVYDVALYSDDPPCASDINGDGTVGVDDMLHVLGAWGTAGPPDPNGDGVVDVVDILLVLGEWGDC